MSDTNEFVLQYIHTMLWQASDQAGAPLDRDFTATDFSDDANRTMRADCEDFLTDHVRSMIDSAVRSHGYDYGAAGHDFALTRNGHGAGFWDRGLGGVGEELTALARPYGSQDVYEGDSGYLEIQ